MSVRLPQFPARPAAAPGVLPAGLRAIRSAEFSGSARRAPLPMPVPPPRAPMAAPKRPTLVGAPAVHAESQAEQELARSVSVESSQSPQNAANQASDYNPPVPADLSSGSRGTSEKLIQRHLLNWLDTAERFAGRPVSLLSASGALVVFILAGALFGFSNAWQVVTICVSCVVTCWLAFVLKATQKRDNEAVQLKLDQLLDRLSKSAPMGLSALETMPEADLRKLSSQLQWIAAQRLHDAYDDQGPTQVLERSSVTRRLG